MIQRQLRDGGGNTAIVICLEEVIRGSTSRYDYVCSEVFKGIASVSLARDIWVVFGVPITDNIEHVIKCADQ